MDQIALKGLSFCKLEGFSVSQTLTGVNPWCQWHCSSLVNFLSAGVSEILSGPNLSDFTDSLVDPRLLKFASAIW